MLLIITPSQFSSAFPPLKTHKEATGILTTIITLDEVYRDCPGRDEAEKVKRCIANFHQQQGVRFVLLVGDSDIFPVRYTKTDRGSEEACNTAFYATDLYYACLYKQDGSFDDWDRNRNGYLGELHGETHSGPINIDAVNLTPTVAVGRIPASSLEEVNRYVQKIIRYESQANGASWTKNALLMATHDWILNACRVQEGIARNYLKGYSNTILSSAGSPCAGAGNLTATAVTEALNRGVGLVGYIGHGSPSSLGIPGGHWGGTNIPQLTNNNRLPIMCVAGCNTAEFATLPPYRAYVDVNGVNHAGTQNGERFTTPPPQPACLQSRNDPDNDLATRLTVRTDVGVAAYLGGITGMQMHQPLEYFFQGMPGCLTIGEAWQCMVRRFYEVHGLPGTLGRADWFAVAQVHQPWKFMLFGDPSLRIEGATAVTSPAAALYSGTKCYFFAGNQYIRMTRRDVGPGTIDPGYPQNISSWGWGGFGRNGIDAALYSRTKCYFFAGNQYIRVTRGDTGAGTVDPGYPKNISGWGWGSFGRNGIDAALYSGTKCYFFAGNRYIRVTRGDIGPGTVDPGYPKNISDWGWGSFGRNGVDAALYSGTKCYFFAGNQYIRVTRGATGPGTVDPGYPKNISTWGWTTAFYNSWVEHSA